VTIEVLIVHNSVHIDKVAGRPIKQESDKANGNESQSIGIFHPDDDQDLLLSNCGSTTLRAVSAPKTGSTGSVRSPICLRTEAWSQ